MNAKLGNLIRDMPVWVPLTLLFTALLLITIIPKFTAPHFFSDNQLAYLSIINGDVKVSDGTSDVEAKKGALINQGARTMLRTGEGTASLKMQDGSSVIVDAETEIEFNRQNVNDGGKSFAFNLVSGKVLVINGQDSHSPTHVLLGGLFTGRVSQAVMGLSVQTSDAMQVRVDCLAGPCLVNGVLHLETGQNASIDMNGTVHVVKGIPYDSWISLGKAGALNPILYFLFANMRPVERSTDTSVPSATILPASMTPHPTATATPSRTSTPNPSLTVTGTRTKTPWWANMSPTPKSQGETTGRTATSPPTSTPKPTLTAILKPTSTRLATITATPRPTSTPVPTATPIPTNTPRPTKTSRPTDTPLPPPTNTPLPTDTAVPVDTPVPTSEPTLPPTEVPLPTVVFTPPPPNALLLFWGILHWQ